MSVFEKWSGAMRAKDADAIIDCLHSDYTFVRHQSGTTMNKAEMSEMMRGFMSSELVTVGSHRCLYENKDILVEHSVVSFPDGTTEAILTFNRLKDGLLIHTETGATLVKNN